MSSLNISIFEQTKQIIPVYWSYCGLGLIALIANCIIVFVYLSSAQLRSRFALFIGLAIAEGINGAGFLITGYERIISEYSLQQVYTYPLVLRWECAIQVGNCLMIIGSQAPAMLSLALGIERFCAIKFPAQYREFKERMFHSLLIITTFTCLLSLGMALYVGIVIEGNVPSFFTCTLSNAFGFTYTTFNYFFTSFGHTAGFVFNVTAFWTIQSFKKKGRMQVFAKEIDQIRLMHFVSICSVIMVVIPNMFLYFVRFNFFNPNFVILGWLNCAFVSRSAFSLHLLGFRSKQFRQRFAELFRMKCLKALHHHSSGRVISELSHARRPYAEHRTDTNPITVF